MTTIWFLKIVEDVKKKKKIKLWYKEAKTDSLYSKEGNIINETLISKTMFNYGK